MARPLDWHHARKLYSRIQRRSEARDVATFNAAVKDRMRGLPAVLSWPELWIKVARIVRFPCRRCAGTGQFITMVENGQPKGPGGICYRCAGTGSQDDSDVLRNMAHDRYYMGRSVT